MRPGLWRRIKRVALTDVGVLVTGLPADALAGIEQTLVEADFGAAAFDMVEALENEVRAGRMKSEGALQDWLIRSIAEMCEDGGGGELNLGDGRGPGVIIMVGVNGVGKTTQAAKLGHRLIGQGKSVLFAAADTFRAGACEQLRIWADRLGAECVSGSPGGDPASVAYDAINTASSRKVDVVLVDTAGRQHTSRDLMNELQKIVRVIGRCREGAPHETLLVLDATVGQNGIQQGRVFAETVPVTGLIVTKLDGTARGGAIATVRVALGIPIRFAGVGESPEDLEPFDPVSFATRIVGS